MKYLFKILTIVSLFASTLIGGTDGTIRGEVLDMEGEAVIGATIVIKEIGLGTAADVDGSYLLLNVPVGTYDIEVEMIGYQKQVIEGVGITMDQTTWLNFTMSIAAIEGETVYVTSERSLVEKGSTSKKITMNKEAIENLPIRNVSELYNLQSGVVRVQSRSTGIPDHEERGLQEVHVRGGRSGEIAYMIDGMYIRNPIYGGIGNGTRLNKFAIQEFDWQPGGFNAEYGDAMSAVSNFHTMSGGNDYSFRFSYDTSLLGEALGSVYDELRDYHDYNIGFGGPLVPGNDFIKFWFSAQSTSSGSYRVYKFDDVVYDTRYDVLSSLGFSNEQIENGPNIYLNDLLGYRGDLINRPYQLGGPVDQDPNWERNKYLLTYPWDNTAGYRGFGFDKTDDYFFKTTMNFSKQIKVNFSYWNVAAHRKNFGYNRFLYWDQGQNEIFRDTERYALEFNHTLNTTSFYTIRLSKFQQDQFIGVRMNDNDNDGYPDWFEWSNPAGYSDYSDPKNPDLVPFQFNESGDEIIYLAQDGLGPDSFTSGWYYGANPGNYNWAAADRFNDTNNNGIYDSADVLTEDLNGNGVWDAPPMVQASIFRDGSYWLTPEMYVSYEDFYDSRGAYLNYEGLDPAMTLYPFLQYLTYFDTDDPGSFAAVNNPVEAYNPLFFTNWYENTVFGGHDRFYSTSEAVTNEIRFDWTTQITDKWRARVGFDYKEHDLNFYEVEEPWKDALASRNRFAERWDDFGVDATEWTSSDCNKLDFGEGNGVWDGPGYYEDPCYVGDGPAPEVYFPGEDYDDFNNSGSWDDFVQPRELALYWQNTFEVPWMVVNAGVRVDAVDYQTKLWSDPYGNYSPYVPWFYFDCGLDVDPVTGDPVCPNDIGDNPSDPFQGNGVWDEGEAFTDNITETNNYSSVIFQKSDWLYKVSPRLGISHVISDGATFTFNYGVYYQTPVYEQIYRNVANLENPGDAFEDAAASGVALGNASMSAGRTSSYEVGVNMEIDRSIGLSAMLWVKDMDQLTTSSVYNSGIYEYRVSKNGDFGTAVGYDLTLELRGEYFNSTVQYTYSTAKASSEYDDAAFGSVAVDAPMQEFLMPYDRTHDLTMSLYTKKLPWGVTAGLTGYFQSGYPYTALYTYAGGDKIASDVKNKNGMRSPNTMQFDLKLAKGFQVGNTRLFFGVDIYNILDDTYPVDVHFLSGKVDDPGNYYSRNIGYEYSGTYFDNPWMSATGREINFSIGVEFN